MQIAYNCLHETLVRRVRGREDEALPTASFVRDKKSGRVGRRETRPPAFASDQKQ
jgi:hypothetical protein